MFQGRFQRAPANEFETTSSWRASVFRHSFGEKYMNDRPQILVVSPDLDHRRALTSILQKDGWSPLHASRLHECHDLLAKQNVGLVFCDAASPTEPTATLSPSRKLRPAEFPSS